VNRRGLVLIHPYIPDGVPDHRGDQRCADCGLPESNRSHWLPETPAEAKAIDERRVGE